MIKRLLVAVAMLCAVTHAQVTVTPVLQPHNTFVDQSGAPCAGCSFYSYTAGTTIPQPTYTDASGGTQNTNPIILSAQGGANIWVDTSVAYKFVLQNTLGATVWSVDFVSSPNGGVVGNAVVTNPSGNQTIAQLPGTSLFLNSFNNVLYAQTGSSLSTLCSSFLGSPGQVVIAMPVTVSVTTTLPANCAINVQAGGSITVSSGTLTINGPFTAPSTSQVFFGSVTGLSSVRPEWFGTMTIGPTVIGGLGSAGGIVQLRTATYLSGYTASSGAGCMTVNNITLQGTQMPDYLSDFTAYQNGTIIQGGFQSCGSNNFTARDIGFDVGSAYIAAGGTVADSLVVDGLSGSAGTNPSDPIIQNPILENVSCLQSAPGNGQHCMLVEHAAGASLRNLQTVYGTHGFAFKSLSSTLDGLYCRGASSDCLTIKGDSYTNVDDLQASHITAIALTAGQVANGVVIDAENSGTTGRVQVSHVVAIGTNIALTFINNSSFGNGAVSTVQVDGLNVFATGPGGSSNACLQTTGTFNFNWIEINNVSCVTSTTGGFAPAQIYTPMIQSQINNWNSVNQQNASTVTGIININGWTDAGTIANPTFSALGSGTLITVSGYAATRTGATPFITDGVAQVFVAPLGTNLYSSADGTKTVVATPLVATPSGAVALRGGAGATTDAVIQNAAGSANNAVFQDSGAVSFPNGPVSAPSMVPGNGVTCSGSPTGSFAVTNGIVTHC